ncbi:hypothetical protein CHS0354_027371 [Potamilus streckersoni]|uniref:Type II secretion system protein GspF domain-containing protein n=1 Tax=Potamilus streckersoni TaxID=2493646 RepID=A0AAE0VZQ2_9BIVA|nr:hypothetical protein CHS0354_027371 [Potamilus streckersoni]
MPIYEYKALDARGVEQKGKMDAANVKQVIAQLKAKNLMPNDIVLSNSAAAGGGEGKDKKSFTLFSKKITKAQISAFTRQFATMIDTGIPYNRALEIIIQEHENPKMQAMLSDIRARIVEGSTLATALQNHADIFSPMYISVVRAGEAGGNLAETMMRQAKFQEEQQALEAKVQTAMVYPMIMSVLGVGIVIFMVKFILPKIIPIFEHFNVQLPLPTRIVIGLSNLISNYGLILLLAIVGGAYLIKKYLKTESGRMFMDQRILKMPLFGPFTNKLLTYRLAQSLGTLLSSGVELRQALDIAKNVTGNKVYEKSIQELSEAVTKKGFSLSVGLKKAGILTDSTIQMIRVGEESGRLEPMLLKISENLEAEVKTGDHSADGTGRRLYRDGNYAADF